MSVLEIKTLTKMTSSEMPEKFFDKCDNEFRNLNNSRIREQLFLMVTVDQIVKESFEITNKQCF